MSNDRGFSSTWLKRRYTVWRDTSLHKLALICRDIPSAASKLSPCRQYLDRAIRPWTFFTWTSGLLRWVEWVGSYEVSKFSIWLLRTVKIPLNGRKRRSTTLHLNNLASEGFSYLGVVRHLAKVVRTMEQSSHATLLTIVARYNSYKIRMIITPKHSNYGWLPQNTAIADDYPKTQQLRMITPKHSNYGWLPQNTAITRAFSYFDEAHFRKLT